MSADQTKPHRRGPAGNTAKTIVVLHEGALWEFAAGTRIRRVVLSGKKWLVIVPATSAAPFLIDNTGQKRTVQADMHAALVKLASADARLEDAA